MYAVIIVHNHEKQALIKTDDKNNAVLVALLCRHLPEVIPGATFYLSGDSTDIASVGVHPDREWIMGKLREKEFPLPKKPKIIDA